VQHVFLIFKKSKKHLNTDNVKTRPEILAPVGSWEMCLAAIHNGADAIYLGVPEFNARGRAQVFELSEIKDIIEHCHFYGVKVFLAFNVLVFEGELERAAKLCAELIKLGPDAFIVQDIGLVRLIKQLAPVQVVHASTQMTVTSAEAVELLEELDIKRYVLGREVSIKEMEQIRAETAAELEVFVHGALCVSYSGQCLTSERIGGRSANRGQCAQSCRLPYDLIVDGEQRELGDKKYLVSPQDLAALDDVPRLMQAGIESFKIEGRLKSPEYVAATVSAYRNAVAGVESRKSETPKELVQIRNRLATTYSRGFFNGWMDGVNHQRLVDGRFSAHRGLELGEVLSIAKHGITLATAHKVQPGDGVVIGEDAGANVYEVKSLGRGKLELQLDYEFDTSKVRVGDSVWLNASPSLSRELQNSFRDKNQQRSVQLNVVVSGQVGVPLSVCYRDAVGHEVVVQSEALLAEAKSSPLSNESLRSELGALAGSGFSLGQLKSELIGALFLHQKELKQIRRKAVAELTHLRKTLQTPQMRELGEVQQWLQSCRSKVCSDTRSDNQGETKKQSSSAQLSVLVRAPEQIEACIDLPIETIYLDYEFGRSYAESVELVKSLGFKVGIATTRIHKAGENGYLKKIQRLAPDTILVRNLGAAQYFVSNRDKCQATLVGDFSLNISNSISAEWFLAKGISRFTPSYDLNSSQLQELLAGALASRAEVTVHQYMPAFHMEHCVFAAFLSDGSSWRDCGKPCEKFNVQLRDRKGALHPVKADMECRNTMFVGTAQSAARLIPELLQLGVYNFRVEALQETATELRDKLQVYSSLVRGETGAGETYRKLSAIERYGVSEGQLRVLGE